MKRKSAEKDDYERLFKKFKKLEKKLRRRCRSPGSSVNKDTQECDEPLASVENNIGEILDGNNPFEPETLVDQAPEILPECIVETVEIATVAADAEPTVTAGSTSSTVPIEGLVLSAPNVISEDSDIPDSVIVDILGEDPTTSNAYSTEIHKDLAIRLEHFTTHGLTKELRKEITDKYLLPTNCRLINAPALNAEIKAAISDMNLKRDRSIESRQKQTATAIACLSRVINKLISNNNSDPESTKMLMDAEKILCDSQHNDSVVRRNFILSSLKKDMKDQLQNTKPDKLLFGQNLSETIKAAKAICRSGAELKTQGPRVQLSNKKAPVEASTSKSLNWKGPFPARKQMNHPKAKGPSTYSAPSISSKQSRQQPKRSRR